MKLKDLLLLNRERMLPNQMRVRKQIAKKQSRKVSAIVGCLSACVALVLVLSGVLLFLNREQDPADVVLTDALNVVKSIEPSRLGTLGMKVTSNLKVTTTHNIPPAELKARLVIEPKADYSVKKIDSQVYELRFEEDLTANTLYTVSAVYQQATVYRWAFQTETNFCITRVYPENEHHVSLDMPIEVTFSHAEVKGFEEAFEIRPAVEGTFEHYGRTWAFVPSRPLEEATLYTVTIKNTLTGPENALLDENYSFAFTTAPMDSYAYLLYQEQGPADTYLVNERPMAMVIYNNFDFSDASVSVYAIDGPEKYIEAYESYAVNGQISDAIMKLAGESPYETFTAQPIPMEDLYGMYEHAAIIQYPDALPQGYYFAEIKLGGRTFYQMLQSTTYGVYTLSANGKHTVWVNDAMKSEAADGVLVSLDGYKEKETNNQGLVTFSEKTEEAAIRSLTVGDGETPYVTFLNGQIADEELNEQSKYFSYLTTNSHLYRNQDEIGVFGVILPRKSDVKIPKKATLEWDFSEETFPVEIENNGSFTATLPLGNTALTDGNIRLMVGDACLYNTYVYIADYELPKYYVNLTTDRTAYEVGDEIQVTAKVTYMDGTPAPDVSVSIDDRINGITDANGIFQGTIYANSYGEESYVNHLQPEVHSIYCAVEDGTDAHYGDDTQYMVLDRSYLLSGSYENGALSVKADRINVANVPYLNPEQLYDEEAVELLRGGAADLELVGELYQITYNKVLSGSTYDPINHQVVYTWEYEPKEVLADTFELSVSGGVGALDFPDAEEEDANYYVILHEKDRDWTTGLKVYLSEPDEFNSTRAYDIRADKTDLNLGDEVVLSVQTGGEKELVTGGSVLFTAVTGGDSEAFFSETARLTMPFKKAYAPDVRVYGAYFDGTHVYSLGHEYLYYDPSYSKLHLEMEKDQLQYLPGDEVTLDFTLTDQEGNPVSAALNISVMDQGLYLIGGGSLEEPGYGLYQSRAYRSDVYTTLSHRELSVHFDGFGEGGGDGEPGRSDFEDTPYFDTVVTDKKGKATVTFSLSDAITDWKVIARAVSEEGQWANEVFDLRSTQEFFAGITMSDSLKEKDDFTIGVKGDGIKIPVDSECTFKVGLTDDQGEELQTLTATAPKSQYTYLNFGKLPKGIYTVYIQAESGAYSDHVIRTFTVESSKAAVPIYHQQEVGSGLELSLKPLKGTVTLTVMDEQKAFWQKAMTRLASGNGQRVDQVLGRYLAERFYADGAWMNEETLDYATILSYMTYDGVSLLPDSREGDLKLSAKLAAVAPEFCDRELLLNAFDQYLNNRYAARVDVLTAYFGLAALGEPVLSDLQSLCMSAADFSAEEYAYMALGLAYCGDYDTAHYLFETHLKELLAEEGNWIYAQEEDLTGCCALLANRLNLSVSEGLMNYIIETDTETTLLHLELISYLNDHVSETIGENTVTIALGDGTTQTHTYSKVGSLVLFLNEAQASKVRVVNGVGNSHVSYSYVGAPDVLADLGGTSPISTDIPASVVRGEQTVLQLYAVIPEDYDCATLSCTLPAGLRLESGSIDCGNMSYSFEPRYNAREIRETLPSGACTINLVVRGALPGEYVLEPITITHGGDHRHLSTESMVFTVVT